MKLPAVFARGGTSKALIFQASDLPAERREWDALFLSAMGSPDRHGRQLNGMGGGISSLSKVCVVSPSTRPDADIDYTFAQVQVRDARVDYGSNCGNMCAAIGPFAVDEELVSARDGEVTVRIYNTNTRKIIRSTFAVRDGRACEQGDLEIPGVAGKGAPIRLDFVDPGGATTGLLMPTLNATDLLNVPCFGEIEASMIDAANACVFLRAEDLGLHGTELPDALEGNATLRDRLASVRHAASIAMGIASNLEQARANPGIPYIGFVSPPQDAGTLAGDSLTAGDVDLTIRMFSNGQPHRALPLTATLCAAVAARIDGTVVNRAIRRSTAAGPLRLGMPSGILCVDADVERKAGSWLAKSGSFYRTTRRLFDGFVYV
jgi:2-methylaconitate cis-trans-isomerase PrpF